MRTIRHHVDRQAQERPDAPYLIAPETGRTLSYRRLRDDSLRLARDLQAAGLAPGATVSLMMGNGYQTARLFIGAMYAGYVVQPVNLLAQDSVLAYVLEHSDSRLVFAAHEFAPRLRAIVARMPRLPAIVEVDPDAEQPFDVPAATPADLAPVGEDDDALLMYTSGTTGVPKGCMLTHRNVVAGGEFTSAAHRLGPGDRVLCALPLYHINGQIVTAVAPLVHGGSVVMPRRFSASSYWPCVAAYRCTWINVVPTIISYLLDGADSASAGLDISRVKFCRSASAPLPPELQRAFEQRFGIGIIETFGMTETAAPCFSNPYERERRKPGSPGMAFGNEAKIVDTASGATLPAGRPGEIMVRGDNVMRAYYKDPATTARTLEPDGWLHSGDLGYLDADGFLFVTGRLKELIIKGGENIAPREIDEALLRHPAVLEAAAVGIPDRHYGQDIMACVVLKPGARCEVERLYEFSREQLGGYKAPRLIKIVDALPKGPSGKVQRLKLLET